MDTTVQQDGARDEPVAAHRNQKMHTYSNTFELQEAKLSLR